MEPIVVGGLEGQGGPRTSNVKEQGGSGPSWGLGIQGKFQYPPQSSSNKGEDLYLEPQGGRGMMVFRR